MSLWLPLLLIGAPCTASCECATKPELAQALADADAVFAGTVVGIRDTVVLIRPGTSSQQHAWPGRIASVSIQHSWKGLHEDRVDLFTGRGGPDCGYTFREGGRYIIYASYLNRSAHSTPASRAILATNRCNRIIASGHRTETAILDSIQAGAVRAN